jgi:hypothetical protein
MNTLISIIIPSYKSYNNLLDWDSRNRPSFFSEVEFIFIDSNTDVQCYNIFTQLTNKYNNIKFVSSDTSIYEAMNLGIQIAESKIIGFMGMDDCLHHEINSFVQYLKNLDFEYSNLYILDVEISSLFNNRSSLKRIRFHKNSKYFHHQSCFFNKKYLEYKNITYNTEYTVFSDMDFIFNVLKFCKPTFINFIGITFSKGGKSTSGNYFKSTFKELFYISSKHKKLLTKEYFLNTFRLLYYFLTFLKKKLNSNFN